MKPIKVLVITLSLFVIVALMQGCTKNLAGATTETTNGITGSILNTDNSVSANTVVTLYTENYDPVADSAVTESFIDTTDSSGNFIFKKITPGRYVIVARNKKSENSTCIRDIEIIEDSLITIPPSNLAGTGSISAVFSLQGGSDTLGYLYIPGTDVFTYVGSSGPALLDNIPSGVINEVVLKKTNGQKSNIINKQLSLQPEQVVTIEYPLWKNSRKIVLNTSSSGAEISSDLLNFPFLIRLTNTNFTFNQAQQNGSDIFFSGKNGKILPFEIEYWDASQGNAAVWVKADTLRGNNSDQYITMYWGNPDPSTLPKKEPVFDTTNGFHSVWHLSESSDTIYDATTNRYKGIRKGAVQQQSGIISHCQKFTGPNGYIDLGNICNPKKRDLTVSVWVKLAKLTGVQTIIAQSNGGSPSSGYGWDLQFDVNSNLHFFTSTAEGSAWGKTAGAFEIWSAGEGIINDTAQWHHLAVVLNRSANRNSKCFLDGIEISYTTSGDISDVGDIVNNLPLKLGAEADSDYPFTGYLDECTISFTARTDAWIKLCSINQGTQDKLVQFK